MLTLNVLVARQHVARRYSLAYTVGKIYALTSLHLSALNNTYETEIIVTRM